jgi:hypothetical protein
MLCLFYVTWITFKETELKITDYSISFGDFGSMIMDELSILHYQQDFNETTGETSFKLVLLDFLELPGTSLFSCCFKCEKPGQGLKLCSRCRRVRYCSVECQRSGWILHKLTCSTPSSNWILFNFLKHWCNSEKVFS